MKHATRQASTMELGRGALLVLSLPSLLFAGFDLARRTYMPVYLTDTLGMAVAQAALFVGVTGAWGVAMEYLASLAGDRAWKGARPRVMWLAVGTALILMASIASLALRSHVAPELAAALIVILISGWTLANVTHGAWALEAGTTPRARAAIFGLRGFFAIAGSMLFALLAAALNRDLVPWDIEPFVAILVLTGIGVPLLHGLLVLRLPTARATVRRETRADFIRVLVEPIRILLANPYHRRLGLLYAATGLHAGTGAASFLIVARNGLGLSASADLVLGAYTAAAAIGTLAAGRWGAVWRFRKNLMMLAGGKLFLALAMFALPVGSPGPLLAWAVMSGALGAAFMLVLRVLLGEALGRAGTEDRLSRGALFYAAFHLPLNVGMAAGAALVLAMLGWAGFESDAGQFEQASYLALSVPAAMLSIVAAAGLWITARPSNPEDIAAENSADQGYAHNGRDDAQQY